VKNHPEWRKGILEYLNQYFKSHLPKDISTVAIVNNKDFFSIQKGLLSFSIHSETDIILAEEYYIVSKAGVYSVIKLKQPKVEEKHVWQFILEMIVTNLYTNDKIKVFDVLIDLNDFWDIFWLSESKEIIVVSLKNRMITFEMIGKIVRSSKLRNV